MRINEYQLACRRTMKPESKTEMLSHALEGLASELGEFAGAIKKYKRYGRILDRHNIREEIGDLLYYASMAMDSIDDSLELAAIDNIEKLKRRYPEGYSNTHAELRLDKGGVGYES
jgi:NTP pyrophosphatase (non-canonical NTP hydrolase)